jgi:HPt (histidine-containing phosphotransfer) domain-containing protein
MTQARDPAIDTLLAAARAQFAVSLPAKARALRHHVEHQDWDEVRRAAHKLRGSGATYGFAALGEAAGAIEELLLEAEGVPGADARARLETLVQRVYAEAERAAGGGA